MKHRLYSKLVDLLAQINENDFLKLINKTSNIESYKSPTNARADKNILNNTVDISKSLEPFKQNSKQKMKGNNASKALPSLV